MSEPCSWCSVAIEPDEGFRAGVPEHGQRAAFCRLEHVVPWAMSGARWEPGRLLADADEGMALGVCAQCGAALDGERVLLVRHRGPHRIGDAFCGTEHLLQWAKRGGRWRASA